MAATSSMSRSRRRSNAIRATILIFGLVLIFIPFVWILLTAFKRPVDAGSVPPVIFSPITFKNFSLLFDGPYWGSLIVSVVLTASSTFATLLFGVPAGYAFARGKFRGKYILGGWLLFSRMVPPVIMIIPLFLFFHQLGLINSMLGLVLAYMTGLLPFTIWLMASYFADLPKELEDAALVDGASRLQVFLRIAVPLVRPGMVTVGVLIAIAAWSEYFIPLLLGGITTTPATVGIVNYIGVDSVNWGGMAAASLTLVIPVLILTLLAQRGLLRGLTAGAVKG
jgi:multiple sugar transport system permease protein